MGNNNILSVARCHRVYRDTSYFDWYHWRLNNWNVTRDMSINHVRKDFIEFDVAWFLPLKIFEGLSKKYPKVTFYCEFAEEEAGYFSGEISILNGIFLSDISDISYSKEAYERYFRLCGSSDDYQWNKQENSYDYIEN